MLTGEFEIDTFHNRNCIDAMHQIDDGIIDLTLTSPPYDGLRDYDGSIIDFNNDFKLIAKELYRITKYGGVVVWVVGDETKDFCESLTSFKQAQFFVEKCKFKLLDTMIYYKQNYAPAYPTLRRYANQFEYMFVFSKGKPKTFNPIQVKKKEHSDGYSSFTQKDGSKIRKFVKRRKDTKDASNVWSYAMGNKTIGHPAVFPEKLAEDHILSWSNKGDLILDPMCGSGTTCKMAKLSGRNFIGIDISKEYVEISQKRISQDTLLPLAQNQQGGNGIPPNLKRSGILPKNI